MSKKKRNQQRMQAQAPSPQPTTPRSALNPPLEQLEAAAAVAGLEVSIATGAMTEGGGAAIAHGEDQAALRSRLQALIDAYMRGKANVEDQEQRLVARNHELDAEQSRLHEERARVEAERGALAQDRRALDASRQELAARTSAAIEREAQVLAREADADAGFVARREEMLRELQRAHEALLERNRQLHAQAAEREQAHLERLARQQAEHAQRLEELTREAEASLEARSAALREAEHAARTRERELPRALFDAGEAARDAEDLKAHVEEYIEERTAERVAHVSRQLEAARRDHEAAMARIGDLERALAEREAAARMLEDLSPEAVRARIDRLRQRAGELEAELADRPSRAEAEELRALREQRAGWEQDRQTLLAEKGRAESRLERLQIEVDAVEVLRDRNRALTETQRLLKAAIDDLRTDIDERLEKHRDQPIFQELLRMDDDPELGREPTRLFPGTEELKLEELAADLQHRIGLDLDGARPNLYYRAEDVRAFLGGLAMSRLHIVQGISGIGKSSLPRAFAEAVGGFCETISVQAGWRDRNDLFGYFNAFERRYYELPFPQAIYKAATRQWCDRVAIVLLDEMNLSHPEQYAADVLDVLERQDAAQRRFELLSFTPSGKLPGLLAGGRFLPLPGNIWFVGTANHDETTKDFADKTYDRAFVLELPPRPAPFSLTRQPRRAPLSHQALAAAFDRAAAAHRGVAEEALAWMRDHLRAPMEERFRVGWGGRLESQARRFIPVVRAAGGGLGEALDQLVTSRVLRKIKGRHDNLVEDLEHLEGVLAQTWPDRARAPVAARALLANELRHLRG